MRQGPPAGDLKRKWLDSCPQKTYYTEIVRGGMKRPNAVDNYRDTKKRRRDEEIARIQEQDPSFRPHDVVLNAEKTHYTCQTCGRVSAVKNIARDTKRPCPGSSFAGGRTNKRATLSTSVQAATGSVASPAKSSLAPAPTKGRKRTLDQLSPAHQDAVPKQVGPRKRRAQAKTVPDRSGDPEAPV